MRIYLLTPLLIFQCLVYGQGMEWTGTFGGLGNEPQAITIDQHGNILTAGYFSSTVWAGPIDLDPGIGKSLHHSFGVFNIYVQKLDSTGKFMWGHTFGDGVVSRAYDVEVDSYGNVYVVGLYQDSIDFDPGSGNHTLISKYNRDIFVLKLSPNGDFLWVKDIKSIYTKEINQMTIDPSGNIILAGAYTDSADFDPGTSLQTLHSVGGSEAFICKWDSNGNFLWVKSLQNHSKNFVYPRAVTVDDIGSIYLTGVISGSGSTDFDPGIDTLLMSKLGGNDAFIQKLSANGDLIWVKRIGNSGLRSCTAVDLEVDTSHNVYITGSYTGTIDFDPGPAIQHANSGTSAGGTIFVLKLNQNGNYAWVNAMGSSFYDGGRGVALDRESNVFTTGYITGPVDMDPGPDTLLLTPNGSFDVFVQKVDSSGDLIWARLIGGNAIGGFIREWGKDLVVNDENEIFILGKFDGLADLDPGPGIYNAVTPQGSQRLFVTKWSQDSCSDLSIMVDSIANLSCNDSAYIGAHISNGAPPYVFNWNGQNLPNDSTVRFDTSGIHHLTVTDANGCTKKSAILINGPRTLNGFDLNANLVSTPLRLGFESQFWIDAFNDGCVPTSGQLALRPSYQTTLDSAVPSPDITAGDTLIWNFSNLTYDSAHITPVLYLRTDTNANINEKACFDLWITPLSGDIDTLNNAKTYCYTILNAYDPNKKEVYPTGECSQGYIENDQLLTYSVHFQNTGNASAINVSVNDPLSPHLDLNSVRVVGQSHQPMITEVLPGDILSFKFNNILLPDSATNEPESHGYIIFEAKPLPNLANDTRIENNVGIYFDFNPPVITNVVHNTIVDTVPSANRHFMSVSSCNEYILDSVTYAQSGKYDRTYITADGCDSSFVLDLTIHTDSKDSLDLKTCRSFTSPSGRYVYHSSGIYSDTIPNFNGCDSILILNLTVNHADTSIIIFGATLTSADSNAISYNWYDCNSVPPNLLGTNQSFSPSQNGAYFLVVTDTNGCTDTTRCFGVANVSVNEFDQENMFNIYPNPSDGRVILRASNYYKGPLDLEVINSAGKIIFQKRDNGSPIEIELERPTPGIYILRITTATTSFNHKLMIR